MIDHLGKYRVNSVLGEGAMGIVYKAFDPLLGRVVALKTIRKDRAGGVPQAELIERFKHEAQMAGRLNHPNIVMAYDYAEDAESAYLAMEFVEGASLDALIVADKPTAPERTIAWMSDLLLALDYAHSCGVIHCDIKPANLMVTLSAHVKVGDFGVARLSSAEQTDSALMIGTPSYMAPEQFLGGPIDLRSDLFAAGIVLYQLLTGARPFVGSASTVMHQVLNLQPSPPSQRLPSLGTAYDEVVARALAKNPDQRFDSARAFLIALTKAGQARIVDPQARSAGDIDRRELAVQLDLRAKAGSARVRSAGGGSGSALESQRMQGWQRDAFPELEIMLARQIGPMAKLLMRKVAVHAESLDDVTALLLPHIPPECDRVVFQEAVALAKRKLDAGGIRTGMRTNPFLSRASGASEVPAPGLITARTAIRAPVAFDDAYLDALTQRLVLILGPIARVVTKRAAKQTADREQLLQLIAGHIESTGDRESFLADAKSK